MDEIASIELDTNLVFSPIIRIIGKDGILIKQITPKPSEAKAVFSTMLIAWDKYKKEK